MKGKKVFKKADESTGRHRQIRDYVAGQWVTAGPEEVQAVQIFARRLVEDYDYPKSNIQTHPQFRVRIRPSDEERSYPIDIAVFRTSHHTEDQLVMVVECKKENRKDGLAQLKLYLDMSPADIGVWFNGSEHAYLRKIHHKDGRRTYQEIPNIPRHGQRVEDIGLYKRKDLRAPSDLKAVFRDVRNHLAGNVTGITRDEALAQQIINLLFCKIYDELNTAPDEVVTFRTGVGEPADQVKNRILTLFDEQVKQEYEDVFDRTDSITIDPASLVYVVGELQNYCIIEAPRDAVGDAFEVFIGPALRGSEGQFFTPRNVVRMMIEILDPKPGQMIIDPACGSGGFLIMALESIWRKIEIEGRKKHWNSVQIDRRKRDVATKCLRGLDKDSFLAKVTKAYMAIMGDGRGGVFCENSLLPPDEWHQATREKVHFGAFDLILTNPPFGTKIPIKGERVLSQYELGFKWRRDSKSGSLVKSTAIHEDQPPQILFLERCLQLLKPGGKIGIVLPESLLGNPSYRHVITFLLKNTIVLGVVTMPESLFKTSGKGGTHCKVCVLLAQNTRPEDTYDIFMAEVKWCGHDSRGNPTVRKNSKGALVLIDEVPLVGERFQSLHKGELSNGDHLGFFLSSNKLNESILVPKYYNPEIEDSLVALSQSHRLVRLGSLVDEGAISIATGIEIGKMAYGTGRIPFIRTSDLSNWEIKTEFKHGVSQEIYDRLKSKVDVQPGDVLMVRDGTYLVGTSAIVTGGDVPMLFQSHIFRIRVTDSSLIDPWLLLVCLNMPIVKAQIRAKQFTQDIIDTLGQRVLELVLPVPKEARTRKRISAEVRKLIESRAELRERVRSLPLILQGIVAEGHEDDFLEAV